MYKFEIINFDDIRSGNVTDIYFERTYKILSHFKIYKKVRAEIAVKSFPKNYQWGIVTGIHDVLEVLQNHNVNVEAVPEGTIFKENEPILNIEGDYLSFGVFETAMLGLLCQGSGIATKSARCKKLADKKQIFSFGARRMHPALAAIIDRNAYIGGCDGVALVKSAQYLGLNAVGTIPHALILIIGDVVEAVQKFDQIMDKNIMRVALIDTFGDEKFEAINVAEALAGKLYGIRLDTPSSRRGDFRSILKEVRWELDLRGYKDLKMLVSGGINETNIMQYNDLVDAYGIGTAISNAPTLDFSMDIVEVDGKPISKRGKTSGHKNLYRCNKCLTSEVIPYNTNNNTVKCSSCKGIMSASLKPVIKNGKISTKMPSIKQIRKYVSAQLTKINL